MENTDHKNNNNNDNANNNTEIVKGVWKRLWEEDPLGDSENADRTTLVLWTQAPQSGIYVDLRLPQGSPGRSDDDNNNNSNNSNNNKKAKPDPTAILARGLSMNVIDEKDISIIFRQKSFAGVLNYSAGDTTETKEAMAKDAPLAALAKGAEDDNNGGIKLCTCFWKREIDYQPPTGGLDIGVCASAPPNADGSINLRETGDDASYAEGWHRLPGTAGTISARAGTEGGESNDGSYLACRLISENGVTRSGFWVRAGNAFAYAIGRPLDETSGQNLKCHAKSFQLKDCVGKNLEDASKSLDSTNNVAEQLQMVGSYICIYGNVQDDGTWKILHSTDPRLVGCNLLAKSTDALSCSIKLSKESDDTLSQTLVNDVVRKWEIAECTEGDLPTVG